MRGFEFERIYILIFFRGIFGILNRAVGPPAEPFRMFPHIGMIRRALIGQIQCDLEPQAFSRGYKPAKIVQRAELRMNSLMSTLLGTNRPRASGFSRLSFPRVVFAFAMCAPDGMDWRKVKDVEPHFSNFRNDPLTILERPAGPRKHFVPGTEPCANRIDSNPQLAVMGSPGPLGIPGRERGEAIVDIFNSKMPCCMLKLPCIGAHRALAGGFKHFGADLKIDGDILIRTYSCKEVLVPSPKGIDPGSDRVDILAELINRKLSPPMVVAERLHGNFRP